MRRCRVGAAGPPAWLVIMMATAAANPGVGHAQAAANPGVGHAHATPAATIPPDPALPAGPRVTLREVLAVAVRRSPSLAQAGLDLAIARGQALEAAGLDDWIASGSASWQSARREVVDDAAYQNPEIDGLALSGGVTRPLPSGGRIGASLDAGWTRTRTRLAFEDATTHAIVASDQTTNVYTPGLTLSYHQPLLKGSGSDVARAPQRQARLALDVATLARAAAAAAVVSSIVQAYWELAYATDDLVIRRQTLALAQEQLRNVRAGIEVGKLAPTASAEVEATIALREEEILLAEQALVEQSLVLRRLVGMPIGPRATELIAADRVATAGTPPDVDRALDAAYAANPELAAARAKVSQAALDLEITEDSLLPQLDFSASAGPSGNSESIGSAFEQAVTFGSWTVTGGLVFSSPVERRAARGRTSQARHTYEKARVAESDQRARIAVETVRAVNAVRSARQRMAALAKSIDLAQANLDSEQARFEVGRSTNYDLLLRQSELAQARLRQARARIDYLKAESSLEALTGTILPRYGIQLGD